MDALKPVDFSLSCDQLLCIEVFAGGATLSQAIKQCGLSILPIDHTAERKPKVHLIKLNLTRASDCEVLLNALCFGNVVALHLAPPCGTSSKARNKPLPPEFAATNIKAKPLRSEDHPLGLPNLDPVSQQRVDAANMLYAFTMVAILIAFIRNTIVSAENPSGSYFWMAMEAFCESNPLFAKAWRYLESVHFQACAWGGTRNTWKCWYSTPRVFASLGQRCPGNHEHAAWKPSISSDGKVICPTSEEAAYPRELCVAHAQALVHELRQRGAKFPSSMLDFHGFVEERSAMVRSGVSSLPPIVSEYEAITDIEPTDADYKVLHKWPTNLEKRETEHDHDPKSTKVNIKSKDCKEWYGIFRTPVQFVRAALTARHPIDYAFPLPDVLLKAVARVVGEGPKLTNARRMLALKKIQTRRVRLQAEENAIHEAMDPQVRAVLQGKNILLWKELALESGFNDSEVFDELIQGFNVTGQSSCSGEYPKAYQPAQRSVEDLKMNSIWLKRRAIGRCMSSGNKELEFKSWTKGGFLAPMTRGTLTGCWEPSTGLQLGGSACNKLQRYD